MKRKLLSLALVLALCLGLSAPALAAGYSDEQLCSMARSYYENTYHYSPQYVTVDREEGEIVTLHLFDFIEDQGNMGHTATSDWYYIDRNTGKGVSFFGETIDLTPYDPSLGDTSASGDSGASGEGVEYEDILFPYLDQVSDTSSAVDAVERMTGGMTSEQRVSPTGVDLATLYAEAAAAKATSKTVNSGEILLNAAAVSDMEAAAAKTSGAMESALMEGGVTTARYLSSIVTLSASGSDKISLKIDPDILTTKVDKIRVETAAYALTLKTSDLAEDLKGPITITAETLQDQTSASVGVGAGFAPGKLNAKTTVKISLPNTRMTNPITVSLPRNGDDTTYQAVVKADGSATASKFNPATVTMDGKINSSGTYMVRTNEKSFSDISNKSAEMQEAILYLTSKGIINGTSSAKFSPDNSISRQQIAALLMRALGKVDNTAETTFTDVSKTSALYRAIASSQKHKILNGYSDNTFRGTNVISKAQIVTVSGRVLTSEMNYKAPANINTYLGKYSDTVPAYAQSMVALATQEGLVVYRTDGTFSGEKNMTRGDAAIILYRLFQRIW